MNLAKELMVRGIVIDEEYRDLHPIFIQAEEEDSISPDSKLFKQSVDNLFRGESI